MFKKGLQDFPQCSQNLSSTLFIYTIKINNSKQSFVEEDQR